MVRKARLFHTLYERQAQMNGLVHRLTAGQATQPSTEPVSVKVTAP